MGTRKVATLARLGNRGHGERIFNQDAFNGVAGLEILGQDLDGMACQGCSDDEGIPQEES